MRVLLMILLVLIVVPTWSGDERLPLYAGTPTVTVARVPLNLRDPRVDRLGPLTFLGGLHFRSADPAFGGYSSMVVRNGRFLWLSDGGLTVDFAMGAGLRPRDYRFGMLPAGPGNGWRKSDRDSESLVADPATGALWAGFERSNAIWRYSSDLGRAVRARQPSEMRRWPANGGPEAMARLPSGRFVVMSEDADAAGGGKRALLFDRDPTDPRAIATPFRFIPPDDYVPTDAVALPDGRLLILVRALSLSQGFTAKLVLADSRAIRTGAAVRARTLATFAYPIIHDNFEGLALSREGDATILWLLSDDNGPSWFQRTLLLKFRLDLPPRGVDPGHGKRRPDD